MPVRRDQAVLAGQARAAVALFRRLAKNKPDAATLEFMQRAVLLMLTLKIGFEDEFETGAAVADGVAKAHSNDYFSAITDLQRFLGGLSTNSAINEAIAEALSDEQTQARRQQREDRDAQTQTKENEKLKAALQALAEQQAQKAAQARAQEMLKQEFARADEDTDDADDAEDEYEADGGDDYDDDYEDEDGEDVTDDTGNAAQATQNENEKTDADLKRLLESLGKGIGKKGFRLQGTKFTGRTSRLLNDDKPCTNPIYNEPFDGPKNVCTCGRIHIKE